MKLKSIFIACSIVCNNYPSVVYNSQCAGTSSQISYESFKESMCTYLAMRDMPILLQRCAPGSSLLDYGSGMGDSTALLARLGFKVHGVDINPHMMERAQGRLPDVEFKLIEQGRIPYDSHSFDIVFSSFVLLEIASRQELVNYFSEAKRVLKDDGKFIVLTVADDAYGRDWASFNVDFLENKDLQSGGLVKTYLPDVDMTFVDYYWPEADIKELIEGAGFGIIQSHYPLGKTDEPYAWKDELNYSPYAIYIAQACE